MVLVNKLIVELSFGVTAREVGTGSGGQESERGAAERKQIQGCSVISYLLLFFSFFFSIFNGILCYDSVKFA